MLAYSCSAYVMCLVPIVSPSLCLCTMVCCKISVCSRLYTELPKHRGIMSNPLKDWKVRIMKTTISTVQRRITILISIDELKMELKVWLDPQSRFLPFSIGRITRDLVITSSLNYNFLITGRLTLERAQKSLLHVRHGGYSNV